MMGHTFDPLTRACSCGMTERDMFNARPGKQQTHDDVMNPGTVEAIYRQRSTGRLFHYRKRVR